MLTSNLVIEKCLNGDEATKTIAKFMKGSKRTSAGYVVIARTTRSVHTVTSKAKSELTKKEVYQVNYDTNKAPALDSKFCNTLEAARCMALNVIRQLMFELGIKKILFIDVPAWQDFQENGFAV